MWFDVVLHLVNVALALHVLHNQVHMRLRVLLALGPRLAPLA